MRIVDDPIFMTAYINLKFYELPSLIYNMRVKYDYGEFEVNNITSIHLFAFYIRLTYTLHYSYNYNIYSYENSIDPVTEVEIEYVKDGRKHKKTYLVYGLIDYYDCYDKAKGKIVYDKVISLDYGNVYVFNYLFNLDNILANIVIITKEKSINLTEDILIQILHDLRYKSIFEFDMPKDMVIGIHYDYNDASYSGIVFTE